MGKQFSAENIEWLIKNYNNCSSVKQLTNWYNFHFGESRSYNTMKRKIHSLFGSGRNRYSQEQIDWVCENAPKMTVLEVASAFNKKFGTDKSPETLKVLANKNGVSHLSPRATKLFSIGDERVWHGYIYVKVSEIPNVSAYVNWMPKHVLVWEQKNGTRPKDKNIVFLDRNKQNCSIENLYALSGKVIREMAKKQWFFEDPELTLTAIKWCELFYESKEFISEVNSDGKEN